MKIFISTFLLLAAISSNAQMSDVVINNKGGLSISENKKMFKEDETRKFAVDYIAHINRKNWKEGIEKYLPENSDAFLKEHTAFRASFPNYNSEIKRMMINGNEVVLWLNITANYVENYRYKNSNTSDQLLWDFEAKNQALEWNEIWYFDVVDGKFGDKWDSLKDNYKILLDLNTVK